MNNTMKKLILASIVSLALFSVSGATVSKWAQSPNPNGTNLISGYCQSTLFTFVNTNTAANSTVVFFDAPLNSITYSNAAYSAISFVPTTITNIYTNYFGVLTTNIYSAVTNATTTVAAATNNFPIAFSVVIPSNTPSGNGTVTLNLPYSFLNGIVFTNNASIAVTVNYLQ